MMPTHHSMVVGILTVWLTMAAIAFLPSPSGAETCVRVHFSFNCTHPFSVSVEILERDTLQDDQVLAAHVDSLYKNWIRYTMRACANSDGIFDHQVEFYYRLKEQTCIDAPLDIEWEIPPQELIDVERDYDVFWDLSSNMSPKLEESKKLLTYEVYHAELQRKYQEVCPEHGCVCQRIVVFGAFFNELKQKYRLMIKDSEEVWIE